MSAFLIINGPNLNLLGSREPEVYGATPLADIETRCGEIAAELGHELHCYQSNAEHELIDRIQQAAADGVDFILLNPGAMKATPEDSASWITRSQPNSITRYSSARNKEWRSPSPPVSLSSHCRLR